MTKLGIMALIIELQQEVTNYYLHEQEIVDKLDEIYFELENMEEEVEND